MAEDSRIVSALPLPPPYYKLFALKPVKLQDAVKEELAASDGAQVSALLCFAESIDHMRKCLQSISHCVSTHSHYLASACHTDRIRCGSNK
jgi:hypothetical protein